MGYTTEFKGVFKITPCLSREQTLYLNAFSDSRRMKRHTEKTAALSDPVREAVLLPVGEEGCFYTGADDSTVADMNKPPVGQPGLWCDWAPVPEGDELGWNGSEKFYDYIEWLEYLIAAFFIPWGRVLNGSVAWQGESDRDQGLISVVNNKISIVKADQLNWKR
jgi:hypothetical protein